MSKITHKPFSKTQQGRIRRSERRAVAAAKRAFLASN